MIIAAAPLTLWFGWEGLMKIARWQRRKDHVLMFEALDRTIAVYERHDIRPHLARELRS